jgi:hypothetical protein
MSFIVLQMLESKITVTHIQIGIGDTPFGGLAIFASGEVFMSITLYPFLMEMGKRTSKREFQ